MGRIAGHYDKVILTLIMCLAILFLATFSPFAESAKAVAVVDDAFIAILIAALAAMGITFITTGSFTSLQSEVNQLLYDYADDSGTSVNSLINGCQSGANKLGRIIVNNRFVQLVQNFGTWLKAKFSLVNNSTVNVAEQGYSIAGVTAYIIPVYLYKTANGATHMAIFNLTDHDTGLTAEGVYCFYGTDSKTLYFTSLASHNCDISYYDTVTGDQLGSGTNNIISQSMGGINITPWHYTQQSLSGRISWPTGAKTYTREEIANALATQSDVTYNPEGIRIGTGDIVLPEDDTDYTEGQGAVIDVGADWGDTYTDITDDTIPDAFSDSKEGSASIEYVDEDIIADEVESTSEITNLPAGTIPFTPMQLPQLHLVDLWHYVAQWIADTAIAAGTLMAIVIQEPSPMVNLFYATVCLAIIFGVIKGLAK